MPLFGKAKTKPKPKAVTKRADRRQVERKREQAKRASRAEAKGPLGWLKHLFSKK